MNILKSMIVSGCVLLTFSNCNQQTSKNTESPKEMQASPSLNVVGTYVTSDYDKRAEGFDWVGIDVKKLADSNLIEIRVRSRADKKTPTCTLDAQAIKTEGNTYKATLEGKAILFTFNDSSMTITSENSDDDAILRFYCSGGASLAGTYKKTTAKLDPTQVDQTTFQKTLSLQGISFTIHSIKNDGKEQLSITPTGLTVDNKPVIHDITGETIVNAEIADMNIDGYPEVLIYTQSHGSGSYGNVIGYSVNNGKSMSQITYPEVAENPKINTGYSGHDSFSLVNGTLHQRFPMYNDGDTNANPTGKTRQVEYELKDGEASRKLVIKQVSEY